MLRTLRTTGKKMSSSVESFFLNPYNESSITIRNPCYKIWRVYHRNSVVAYVWFSECLTKYELFLKLKVWFFSAVAIFLRALFHWADKKGTNVQVAYVWFEINLFLWWTYLFWSEKLRYISEWNFMKNIYFI